MKNFRSITLALVIAVCTVILCVAGAAPAQTTFSNTAQITIPSSGTATPYPSNITVSGLRAGEVVSKITVTLNGFSHSNSSDVGVLLVDPLGDVSVNLTGRCGGGSNVSNINLTFDDAAATTVPSNLTAGTYKPSLCSLITYSAPAPPPSSYRTALSSFENYNPNGVWSLYVEDFASGNSGSISGGWSLSITTKVPTPTDLTVTKSHNGNFQQGQTGAQYGISVSNLGEAQTSGTITVTDALPAGLTATAIGGTGWNCTLSTLTCTRNDVLLGLRTAPTITVTVNVDNNAPSSVTNTATVSGGGDTNSGNNTATDPTTVTACNSGDIVVTNNADNGSGSLRQAIADVCHNHTITVANTVTSPITLTTTLLINKSLTISGPGANVLTVSGNNSVRVFTIQGNTGVNTVTISGLTIANGNEITDGGGIQNRNTGTVNIINSIITGNRAGNFGGGISNRAGTMNITNSTVFGNSVSGNAAFGDGGGINNQGGTLNISNSTISGNSSSGYGGGIHNDRITTSNVAGIVNIVNSTFSGNSAAVDGGGIYNFNGSTINILSGTISANTAGENGGGIFNESGTLSVKNTIIAGNTGQIADADVSGAFTSQGFNLIGKKGTASGFTNGANSDQVGTDAVPINPMLAALANNGGATMTHALLNGSPAIDKGSSFGSTTDQRGFARPADFASIPNAQDGTDIGAFELQQTPTAASVTVGGRLLTANKRGIVNALVQLTEADGTTRTVSTGAFGYYRFADVSAGQTVILQIFSKRFAFANSTRIINVSEEITDANFVALP